VEVLYDVIWCCDHGVGRYGCGGEHCGLCGAFHGSEYPSWMWLDRGVYLAELGECCDSLVIHHNPQTFDRIFTFDM